jgi:hypothetical protein
MAALHQLDFEQEEQPATDEQYRGEELSRIPAEEKWRVRPGFLIVFSASLALWAVIIFVISQIFF